MWPISDTDTLFWSLLILTFFVAGLVKGVTGMGLPTVAMGVLGAIMPPVAAAALLVVPSFVTNVWQLVTGLNVRSLMRRLWPMMLGIVAGTLLSASLLTGGDTHLTTAALGFALLAYSLYTLFAKQVCVPPRLERWLSPLSGLTTGAITGGTGVFVIPAVPYLQALGLSRDDLIQALGLSFTVSTIALAAGLALHGAFNVGNLWQSALLVVPALMGMVAGTWLRQRISPALFRKGFLICLALLGAELASRAFR